MSDDRNFESGTANASLRELAEKATPGPWFATSDFDHIDQVTRWRIEDVERWRDLRNNLQLGEDGDTACFIAAANPAAVLELLDERDAARAERDRLRSAAELAMARLQHESERMKDECTDPDGCQHAQGIDLALSWVRDAFRSGEEG